jgi:hypothetical protein
MKQIAAYEDISGNIHKTARDATRADFISLIRTAWDRLPNRANCGDPVMIAQMLMPSTAASARRIILEAINGYEAAIDAERIAAE